MVRSGTPGGARSYSLVLPIWSYATGGSWWRWLGHVTGEFIWRQRVHGCSIKLCQHANRASYWNSYYKDILFFFGMGTMMDFLKHEGTTDRERDRLKMSVKTPASWKAHALSTQPGMPSGPTALRMFTRLKDRVTSATERVSGLTSSAAAVWALSVWTVLSA